MANNVNLNVIKSIQPSQGVSSPKETKKPAGPSFEQTLNGLQGTQQIKKEALASVRKLEFSNHAVERMQSRGVFYSPDQLDKIEGAISKAQSKGAKETLVISEDSALIVNVDKAKVVTVMDKTALKDNVFTNIDSTVII